MTTQQPTAQRLLRRRSDDRVIGGVASGLGDYFNIDPLLIRIGFVGLMVFGGMGFLLYVAAWVLVPDDATNRSIIERLIGRAGQGGSGLLVAGLLLIGAVIFFSILGDVLTRSDGAFALGLALLIIVVGAVILRRGEPGPPAGAVANSPESSTAVGEPEQDTAAAAAPSAELPRAAAVRRVPRPPSPLGWYVLGALLVILGGLALAANVAGLDVKPGHYFGVALGVIGLGLVIGAWWGHARALILLGLVLLPLGYTASLVTVPIDGGWGSQEFAPRNITDVRDEYRLAGGQLVLDLTELEPGDDAVTINASVAMGELIVLVPDGASVELAAAVGGGRMVIFDERQSGTTLEERVEVHGDGPPLVLDLEAGLGEIHVETIQMEDR